MGYHFVLKVRFSGDDPVLVLFLFPLRSERLFQNRTFRLYGQFEPVARVPQNVAHRCKRLFSSEVYLEKCCTYAFCHIFFFSNRSATYPKLILYFVTRYLSNTYFASKALHLIILYNARIRARGIK